MGETTEYSSTDGYHGPDSLEDYSEFPNQIVAAWELVYLRPPTQAELQITMEFAARQLANLHADERGILPNVTAGRQALINLCQVLLNSSEFLYVD